MLVSDQLGRKVDVPDNPQRIISLVPSQTELLYDLGLGDRVVGITKFCVHPEAWFRSKTRIGGTKQLHLEKIASLAPDLIIGNKEENEESQIKALMQQHTVWMSDIISLEDNAAMIEQVGVLTGTHDRAKTINDRITVAYDSFHHSAEPLTAGYLIWQEPYMAAGHSTFITTLMKEVGLTNILEKDRSSRYPETSIEALQAAKPQVLLLSSEPYPFAEKHREALQAQLPDTLVVLVDGEFFSWYGSRLIQAWAYFSGLMDTIRSTIRS